MAGNFFFDLFPHEMIPAVLEHLIKLTRVNGYLVISDFAYPQGNPLANLFKQAYWSTAILIFCDRKINLSRFSGLLALTFEGRSSNNSHRLDVSVAPKKTTEIHL